MKIALRIALTPAMMLVRLALGLTAFFTSIASSVIGLCTSVFAVLGVIEFCIGNWQNGFAFFALALLSSPIGLPMLSNILLTKAEHAILICEKLLNHLKPR